MRRYPRACLLLAFSLMAAAVLVTPDNTMAKGTPWEITVEGEADDDGGRIRIWIWYKFRNMKYYIDVRVQVPPGTEAGPKATQIAKGIDISVHLAAQAADNKITLELEDDCPFEDIIDIEFKENETGEKLARKRCDSAPGDSIFTGSLDIEGTGGTPGAEAVLQIGAYGPIVSTSTEGKTADDIEADLVDTFNVAYYGTGYTAQHIEGKIIIDSLRCEVGIAGGSDDSQLAWTLALRSMTPRGILPGLSTLGLTILSALVLITGIWLYRHRRVRPAGSS